MIEIKNEAYKQELIGLKEKMIKAEQWADKMPIFRDIIISNKISGEEIYYGYGKKYKSIYLLWGINRGHFSEESRRTITNYSGDYDGYFWKIYINSLSLYDSHEKHNLYDIVRDDNTFFFDRINTTFYATDSQIEKLLEALNDWYLIALEKEKEIGDKKKIEQLELELSKLKNKD